MSNVVMCDKCHKVITPKEEESGKTSSFRSEQSYTIEPDKKKMKIMGQSVQLILQIVLECGQHMDLCHKCGWAIINKFTK